MYTYYYCINLNLLTGAESRLDGLGISQTE
jgi:hypothetical protein